MRSSWTTPYHLKATRVSSFESFPFSRRNQNVSNDFAIMFWKVLEYKRQAIREGWKWGCHVTHVLSGCCHRPPDMLKSIPPPPVNSAGQVLLPLRDRFINYCLSSLRVIALLIRTWLKGTDEGGGQESLVGISGRRVSLRFIYSEGVWKAIDFVARHG